MLIGIIGSPNKGKSTLFSALTMVDVAIANYPFTTIKPNLGVGYATTQCVEKELRVRCTPRNSLCTNGIRQIPINITDVAGLVPDAYVGKGMGNQFLNDLMGASALIQVVDLSGKSDMQGNAAEHADPAEEVKAVRREIALWLWGILMKHMGSISKRSDGAVALREVLSGFNLSVEQIKQAADACFLSTTMIGWSSDDTLKFAERLLEISKPTIVAANKLDQSDANALQLLKNRLSNYTVVGCSGAIELALRKAAASGAIDYTPGSPAFSIKGNVNDEQRQALAYMAEFLRKNNGTGVQELINTAVFKLLDCIVVYPVEDEGKYTDHFGNVLPDAILLKRGSTALQLAQTIHTDLARGMLYAVDARSKMKLAKAYVLKDMDVIKIVSTAK